MNKDMNLIDVDQELKSKFCFNHTPLLFRVCVYTRQAHPRHSTLVKARGQLVGISALPPLRKLIRLGGPLGRLPACGGFRMSLSHLPPHLMVLLHFHRGTSGWHAHIHSVISAYF